MPKLQHNDTCTSVDFGANNALQSYVKLSCEKFLYIIELSLKAAMPINIHQRTSIKKMIFNWTKQFKRLLYYFLGKEVSVNVANVIFVK